MGSSHCYFPSTYLKGGKQLNKNFKVGDHVICTFGTNKGKELIIELVLKDGYSCRPVVRDGKYYFYDDNTLIAMDWKYNFNW